MTLSVAYAGTVGHHLPGAAVAGQFTNQIPLKYLPLGATLNSTLVNTTTGVESATTLAAVQAVFPGLLSTLPFPNFVGTVAQALKPYPQYTSLSDPWLDVGNSSYHALQVSFNRRISGGLTFMANYVFSKEEDDLAGVRVPGEDNLEWSVGALDRKNTAQGTFLYRLPFGVGHKLSSDNLALRDYQRVAGLRHRAGRLRCSDVRHRQLHRVQHYRCFLLSELHAQGICRLFGGCNLDGWEPVAERQAYHSRGCHFNPLLERRGLH